MACTAPDIRAGLRAATACGDSASPPGDCSGRGWTAVQLHNGSGASSSGARRRCAREAFDDFLCSLPARSDAGRLRPADWAFGAEPPSVGKSVGRLALQLYLSSTAARRPFRHVLRAEDLRSWRWRPKRGCDGVPADEPEAWLRADVCAPRSKHAPALSLTHARAGDRLLELVRGNSSGRWSAREDRMWVATAGGGRTTAGLWVAGQMVRLVRHALGPCTRASAASLLASGDIGGGGGGVPPISVAVHMRRGDACERWAPSWPAGDEGRDGKAGRPCFAAEHYLAAARALVDVVRAQRRPGHAGGSGEPRLLVASDSASAVGELRALARSAGFVVVQAGGPRGEGWGGVAEGANLGRSREAAAREFIEARNERGLVDRAAVVGSFFADVELMSRADALVGSAASWTSRVALLAIVGESGVVPPFAMVDRPLQQLWFA